MKTIKEKFWKCLDFIYKHKVIAFFVAFGIATSFILYGVLANDDEYANKLVVTNTSIIEVKDGTSTIVAFDDVSYDGSDETAGKDSSDSNGILRNYDSISYKANYKLALKEGAITDPIEGRILVVDVIVPKAISATLTSDNQTGDGETSALSLDENYNYYEFFINNVSAVADPTLSEFQFSLNNVNTKTINAEFSPIVLIQETTDENYKPISNMTTDEKEGLMSSLPNNQVLCTSTSSMFCNTTITGYYSFDVGFYQGAYNESQNTLLNKIFPIGIAVTIPTRLIGIYIPNSISFELGMASDPEITVELVENSFTSYKDLSKNYSILYSDTEELPNITNTVSYSNGVVTISNLKLDGVTNAIGTAAFELSSTRASEADKNDREIGLIANNLKIGDQVHKASSGAKIIVDHYEKFVGKFGSRIDIYSYNSDVAKFEGNAILDLNQPIRIEETISYSPDAIGDDLSELHTYIKIDSDAFLVTEEDNTIDNVQIAILRYGHGLWNSDYFELTGVSGCPSNIGTLSKENLMNLYGGPCIREKSTVVWNDNESELPIIIVDAVFGDATDDTLNVSPATTAIIKLSGKIKSDPNIVYNSYQISTISTGLFNNQLYYLSTNVNTSDITNAKNPNNYGKSVYNFSGGTFGTNNTNPCNNYYCNITGDTAHIMGFTVNYPDVQTFFNDVPKTSFYDYPIEWRISQNAQSYYEGMNYSGGRLAVFVPNTLNYLYAETLVGGKRVRKTPSEVNNVSGGKMYVYNFAEDEIHDGVMDTLSVFTDIYLNTKSGTKTGISAFAIFDGYIINGTTVIPFYDMSPYEFRTVDVLDTEITLNNGSDITTYGNANPRYIEKGTSYTYTMKAFNNSSSDSNSGYSFANPRLFYMLPYIEDSSYKVYKNKFNNSGYKIKLNDIGSDYTVYYTNDSSKNVVSAIYYSDLPGDNINWSIYTPGSEVEATAIKIEKNTSWDIDTYFGPENGIVATITPINNSQADAYYNGFVITVDRPVGYPDEPCDELYESCENRTVSSNLYYQSSKSLVEVYSRQISGFVFEDYNYSDLYELGEKQLENIVVELYKLNSTDFDDTSDSTNPNLYIDTTRDTLVSTTTTDARGNYTFTGLEAGNFYVLFRYDGDKYTPCNKNGGEIDHIPNASRNNSKAISKNLSSNEAVTDIIRLSASSSDIQGDKNLGLRIRKDFGVEINKYITNIVQTSNQGTKVYEYNKATKVNIDIKNMKNTKFRVTYSFDIVNTKYFPGYVGIIADLVPAGMTFDGSLEENKDWTIYDGVLYYTGLQNKLLFPGDKHYFKLVLDVDTNQGGTYLNIVAAQQPILMGEESSDYDFSSVTVDTDTPVETSTGDDNTGSGDTTGNGNGE